MSLAGRFICKARAGARLLPAAALALLAATLAPLSAAAATIAWNGPAIINDDTDVVTNGTAVYAYTGGSAGQTVNGETFAAGNSGTAWGANVTLTGFGSSYSGFGGGTAAPWSGLSTAYQTVLQGGAYGGASAGTVTLNNLTVGHVYSVQIWVNDSRSGITGRTETAAGGGNTVLLVYNANAQGSLGEFAVGYFVANAATQSFTLTPGSSSGSVQLNALSVYDLGGSLKTWLGTTDNSWGTPGNWAPVGAPTVLGESVLFNNNSPAGNLATLLDAAYNLVTLTLSNAPAPVSVGNDGNTLTLNGGVSLLGASQSLTISDPVVLGASQTWNVANNGILTITNGGVAGSAALTIAGGGTVSFGAPATYTGDTFISGGNLTLTSGASLASENISVAGTLTVGNGASLSATNITVATSSKFALSGSGALAGGPTLTLAGGATFDVSAESPTFALNGGTVTNATAGAILNGPADFTSGTLSMAFDGVNPPFIQTNGTLTLSSATVVTVNNTGAVLLAGTYPVITAATTGNVGSNAVSDSLPAVVLTGNGAVGPVSLAISPSGTLQMVVGTGDVWTGASDNTWENAGNWTGGNPGGPYANPTDPVVFNNLSTANLNTTLSNPIVANSVSVLNPSAAVSIGGSGSLEIGNGGINMQSASQDLTISVPLTVPDSANWNVAAGRNLNINGGATGGSGPTIVGAGSVNLNSPVTFQGTTTVSGGSTLKMTAPNVLSSVAASTLAVNGVLDLNSQSEAIDSLSGNGIVDNTGVGPATLTNGFSGDSTTFNGIIRNTGGPLALQVNGGNLTLNSTNNSYSGGTTFNQGATLWFPISSTLSTGPVTFNPGSGTYTGNSAFTNALSLNGCWLRLGGNLDSQTWSGPVTVTNNFQMSGDNGGCTLTLSGPMNIGTGGIVITNFGNEGPPEGYNVSLVGDALTGVISGSGGITYYLNGGNSRLTVQGANTYTGGTIVNGTGNGKLNVWGGVNPFSTGPVTLNSGAIIEAAPSSATVTNALTLNGGILQSEPQYNNYNTLTWTGPITMTADSALIQGATGALNSNQSSGVNVNGPINIGGFTLACFSSVATYGGNTINGPISGSGLIIVSNNVLQLNGTNTFAGTFRAAGGSMGVGNSYALQNAILDMNADDTGAVSFSQNPFIGALSGTRNLANAGYTFTIGNNNNNNATYSGNLTGNGGLIKIGSSTQTLSGVNAYGGNTTVAGGTLSLAQPTLALLSTLSVSNGAVLNLTYNATNPVTALVLGGTNEPRGVYNSANSGGLITGSGSIQVGVGQVVWTGRLNSQWTTNLLAAPYNWSYNSNAENYADGSAVLFDDTLTNNSTVNITNGNVTPAQVNFNNNKTNYTFLGTNGIVGSCALVKNGTGSVTLNTTNTYTGPTTVNAGVLTIGGSGIGSLGNGSYAGSITNNGTLNFSSATAQTLSGAIVGTGVINDSDTGGMALNGANTFSGGFNLNPGAGNLGSGTTSSAGVALQFGTGPVSMSSSAQGTYAGIYGTATQTYTNTLTANGALVRIGGGNSRQMTWAGPVILSTNGLEAGGDGGTSASGVVFTGNFTFNTTNSFLTAFDNEGCAVYGGISGNGVVLNTANSSAAVGLVLYGPLSGSMSLYNVSGTVTLSGASTFTGTLRSGGGSVTVANAWALQNATLDMNPADSGTVTFNQASFIGSLTDTRNLASSYTLTVGSNNASSSFGGVLSGTGGLTKAGTGMLTLSGANTYTGATTVNGGDLVVNGGSIASAVTAVAGGAILDVSAAASTLTLGSSSTLANTSVGAVLNGAINASVGTLSLVYDGVHPAFIQTNGSLTVSSSTVFTVNNVGPTLTQGAYQIIAAAAAGNPGSVSAGALPQTVIVTGNGAVGLATLQINGSGGLNLVVGSPLAWTGASSTSWNTGGNWTTASVPTNGSIIDFTGASTANLATVLNANFNLLALNVLNPAGAVSIGGANTLTLTNGISLAAATTNLTITAPVVLGASQPWTVTNNSTLSVSGGVSGSGALTVLGGGTVALGGANTYSGATIVNGGNLNLIGQLSGSSITVSNGGAINESASGVITGSATFTQNSAKTSTLGGPNTFTGAITVSAGELDITNWGATGLAGPVVGNTAATATLGIFGGTLALGANTFTIGSGSSPAYTGIVNQTGGTVSYTGGTATLIGNGLGSVGIYNLSGGTFTSGAYSANNRGVMLAVNSGCTGIFNLSGTGVLSFPLAELQVGRNDSAVWGGTAIYTQNGGTATFGYLAIGGSSTSSGTIATFAITNGTFVATNFQTLVAAPSSIATLYLGGGAQVTLPAFPTRAGTANITFDFTNGFLAPLAASASYLPAGTFNNANLTTNGANFNVASLNPVTVGQILQNAPAQAGTLTKSGPGTLTLSAANTYTGATTVSAGELVGASGSSCASSPVTVAAGATNGVQVLAANGQWTCGALNYGAGTAFADFNLGGFIPSTTTAPLQVAGTLAFNGSPNFIIRNVAAGMTNGVYPLISYGSLSGTPPTSFISTVVSGSLSNNAASKIIYLVVNNAAGNYGNPLLWAVGSGNWDAGVSGNWKNTNGTPSQLYYDPTAVIFDDTASGASPILVNKAVTVSPASVTVNSTNKNYVISGSAIAGAATLTKNGSGRLTISSGNTYTGNTVINGGTLEVDANSALGTGQVTLSGGALSNNVSATLPNAVVLSTGTNLVGVGSGQTLTLAGAVSSTGGLVLSGPGTLSLAGADSYIGGTTVGAGRLQIRNTTTSGTNYNIAGGATLELTATTVNPLSVASIFTNSGTLLFDGGGNGVTVFNAAGNDVVQLAAGGLVWVTGNTTVTGSSGYHGIWSANLGSLEVDAGSTINFVETGGSTAGTVAQFDALNGGGTISMGYQFYKVLSIGNANGSGIFSGSLKDVGSPALLALVKNGTGTETLTGTNTYTSSTTINGGTLTIGGAGVLGNGAYAALITNNAALNYNSSAAQTLSGIISGTGSLTNSGPGALTLSAANTYAGRTTITGGVLLANNTTGSATGTNTVNISTGGALGGTGIISGAVTNNSGGILLPGANGIGTLTVSNYLALLAGSTSTFAVNGSTPTNTGVALGGNVTYGGVLNIVTNGTFSVGQKFTLFSGAGATNAGNFASIAGSPGAGKAFSFTNGVLTVVASGPTLTSVTPNPATGSSYAINLSLTGSGFTGATAVLLTNMTAAAGASYVPVVNSDSSISVSFVPGTAAGTWNATVVNGTPSAQVPFTVTVPGVVNINAANLNAAGPWKLVLSGTGGVPGHSYAVMSSTNLSQSVWTPVATNTFNADGSFGYTNTVNAGTPSLFLRIQQ